MTAVLEHPTKRPARKDTAPFRYRILCDMKDWSLTHDAYARKCAESGMNIALFRWRPYIFFQNEAFRKVVEKAEGCPVSPSELYNPNDIDEFNDFAESCHANGISSMLWYNEFLIPTDLVIPEH